MLPRVTLLLMLLTLLLAVPAPAEPPKLQNSEPAVTFNGIRLTLGMPQDEVLALLGRSYKLTQDSDSNTSYMLISRTGPPFELFGHVQFEKQRLLVINKHHNVYGEETVESVGRVIYAAFDQFYREGHDHCAFQTRFHSSSIGDSKTIEFYCGAKSLDVSFNSGEVANQIGITETLMRPR